MEGGKGNSRSSKGSEIQSVRLNSRSLVTTKEILHIYLKDYYGDMSKEPNIRYMIWQVSRIFLSNIEKKKKKNEKEKRLLASK